MAQVDGTNATKNARLTVSRREKGAVPGWLMWAIEAETSNVVVRRYPLVAHDKVYLWRTKRSGRKPRVMAKLWLPKLTRIMPHTRYDLEANHYHRPDQACIP